MKSIRIINTLEDISSAVEQIDHLLKAAKISNEHRVKATLTLEETLVRIAEMTQTQIVPIQISLHRQLRKRTIRISYKGAPLKVTDLVPVTAQDEELGDVYGPEAEELIRDMVLRANAERLNCRYSHGVNTINIIVTKTDKALLYDTLTALTIGFLCGLLLRNAATPEVTSWISTNIFSRLYGLFITAIGMIIAPFIFFSLSSSIAGFSDLASLGRTGTKVFSGYLITTLLCILICMSLFFTLHPGAGVAGIDLPLPTGTQAEEIILSPIEKLLSIIPTSFVGSFVANDMLQIMFLAILVGITISHCGKYSEKLRDSFAAFNELFSSLTGMLSKLLPIAIFGSTANMAATLQINTISVLTTWIGYILLCIVLQFLLYIILIIAIGRLNPVPFLHKFFPAMLTALVTSSSSVTIPTSQECCRKMGISSHIYSFSIPLGANINMDGTSLLFCATALFLTNIYGVSIEPSALISLGITIMLISVALPGVPGAGAACLLMVFAIVGVPAEAFGLIIGLEPLIELLVTSLNVAGDGAMTTIVANSEGALDKNMYNV